MMKIAVIGGTGVYDSSWLASSQELRVETPYGPVEIIQGQVNQKGDAVYFLNRHGTHHQIPPHLVNYRANIWALKHVGVERIMATAAVGSLNVAMPPGNVVLCDQFLDFTKSRVSTFFEGGPQGVVHTDMTEPYCPHIRKVIYQQAVTRGYPTINGGCYVATEGPRFETPAEIRAFRLLGGDVVGMTSVPEVILARELGLCYSTLALVTNYAAGISPHHLTHQEVLDLMAQNMTYLKQLIVTSIPLLQSERDCYCHNSADTPLGGS
ncbi:MAG: 5'-methylthioadenosine phosphorylase [Sulfobacillus thermosulfidooxidans]|uniref:Probable 6-oxopurine nucleoside phosphorylase n=1 Tax=Sulfobacillus thermosulfidooxidans TaxID=28034 RepID=A0A2T2WZI8_SULTH|nr:MAG: 5'-methylthioadenosine phosphorylase [Sulfobacillus thermosulfidooxidans]